MEFIEAPLFTKLAPQYMSDDELSEFQWFLVNHPKYGDVIPGSGGLRKIRWKGKGRGKRGGIRVIYYYQSDNIIWLLTVYAKNEVSNIPSNVLKALREELEQ